MNGEELYQISRIQTLSVSITKNRNFIKRKTIQTNMKEINSICKKLLNGDFK